MRKFIDIIKEGFGGSGLVEGPLVDGRIVPRLHSGDPPEKLFRIMSAAEYDTGVAKGFFAARERIHASVEPHLEYCEPGDGNVLVAISYDDTDGWKAKWTSSLGVVAITSEPIPASKVSLLARGTRADIEAAL